MSVFEIISACQWVLSRIGRIITCRSEILSDINRRDLLFGPLDNSTKTLSPNSFLEFVINPFIDSQVSSYLKKYRSSSDLTLWSWVKNSESLIDSCKLREFARVPLFLSLIVEILPDLPFKKKEQNASKKTKDKEIKDAKKDIGVSKRQTRGRKEEPKSKEETKSKEEVKPNEHENTIIDKCTRRQLFEHFIMRAIDTAVQKALSSKNKQKTDEEAKILTQKLEQQLQNLALRQNNLPCTSELEIQEEEQKENDALLTLCPLLGFDSKRDRITAIFTHKTFRDFFVTRKIEEEIIRVSEDEASIDPNRMILNQNLLLAGSAASILVFQFLVDALNEGIFPASTLISLIENSRAQGSTNSKSSKKKPAQKKAKAQEKEQIQEEIKIVPQEIKQQQQRQQYCNHPISAAAANAITILNAIGYDFKQLDFSGVCFAGADLNHGLFEGTDFTGGDLQGVNFSGAWLNDTKFVKANMKRVQFGVVPDLQLSHKGECFAYSPNGVYMVIAVQNEIVVLKKHSDSKLFYKEINRLRGQTAYVTACCFRNDGQYIVSGGADGTILIWHLESGECIQVQREHCSSVLGCEINQDKKHMISLEEDQIFKKWSASADEWTLSYQFHSPGGVTNCGFVPNHNQLVFLGKKRHGPTFYHAVTGKYISKFIRLEKSEEATMSKFSSDGKQTVISCRGGSIYVLDGIRGHLTKTFPNRKGQYYGGGQYPLFSPDGTEVISRLTHSFSSQNVADGKINLETLHVTFQTIDYSIDHIEHDHLAVLLKDKQASFFEVDVLKTFHKAILVKGGNQQGFSLTGTNIDDCVYLSEENVRIFNQIGDYRGFRIQEIQELIVDNPSANPEKITELHLSIRFMGSKVAEIIGRNSKCIDLQRLDLSKNRIEDSDGVKLGKNVSLKNLQELVLNDNQLGSKSVSAIAENPSWKSLKKLLLSINKIPDSGTKALGKNSIWENLEELTLSHNNIGDEGTSALGQDKSWNQLKKLDLSLNKVGDKGAAGIAANKAWISLEELNLSNNKIGDKGASEIAGKTVWTNLRVLSLETNQIGDSGATAIAKNNSWINLEELYVFNNNISEKCANTLQKSDAWKKLQVVIWYIENKAIQTFLKQTDVFKKDFSMVSKGLRDIDGIIIGKKIHWPYFEALSLGRNNIGDKGAVSIGKNTVWYLEQLDLHQNNIGDEGAMAIGTNTAWNQLIKLDLHKNLIGDKGAIAIGNNTSWSRLEELYLNSNKIREEGAASLGSNETWSNLDVLYLQENQLGDKGAVALGRNMSWRQLTKLKLSSNKIGDVGAEAIWQNYTWSQLEELDLSHNQIGDGGALPIERNSTFRNLSVLNLSANKLGNGAAVAIGKNVRWINLKALYLNHNEIGDEGAVVIAQNTAWKNLAKLEINGNSQVTQKEKEELKKNLVFGRFVNI